MKPTLMDRFIGWVSPTAGLRRVRARATQEMALRAYDAAKTYASSDWISAQNTSANAEIRGAQTTLREKSRDLGRNNPYAVRALNVIVSNVVGPGIKCTVKGRNKTQTKTLQKLWDDLAYSSKCDAEGRNDFCGLQALAMRTLVESGDVLGLRQIDEYSPRVKLLESDFIATVKDQGPKQIQGIEVDTSGKRTKYHLYKSHPGDRDFSLETFTVNASDLIHAYRQERTGQLRGVPWSHAVIETLKDFADYQNATLVRQKIAACFAGFITTAGNDSFLSATELQARRESEMQLKPGMFRYLNPGEDLKLASPPGVDGYADFTRESMRAVAAGYGISYEAMTGDYSQVNFSSGRMGHIEFRRNIDSWRWNILIPFFCDPYFQWFLEWARLRGHDTTEVFAEWTPPAHTMIDPSKEIAADKEAVMAGFKSRSRVIRENGDDPEMVLAEISEERKAAEALGLKFDTDTPSEAEEVSPDEEEESAKKNKEDAPDESYSSGDQ